MRLDRTRIIHGAILLGGLLCGQVILFGPSLAGRKVLLPLDILARPHTYLSPAQSQSIGRPWDWVLSDPVLALEPQRRMVVSEVRAGRMPLWDPHQFCGAPLLAASQSAVFSPFRWLDYLWPGPWVLAWDQVLKALVAGIGAYLFFRRSLEASFAAAVIGAWIWSLGGYSVQWAGYPASAAAVWLPWIFYFTDRALRPGGGKAGIGLALASGACLVSGHAETSAQVLMIDGLFFLWRFLQIHGWRGVTNAEGRHAGLAVIGGWVMGMCLSAPQSLPTLEYARHSYRMAARATAPPETPPAGYKALVQLLLPDFNGATRGSGFYFGGLDQVESASVGYAGLMTALVFAPLAVLRRGWRSWLIFFALLGVLGMGQILHLPVLWHIYGIYPLNLMRENRLVLASGWSIAVVGVMGLDMLSRAQIPKRGWMTIFAVAPAGLGVLCVERAIRIPQALRTLMGRVPSWRGAEAAHWFTRISFEQAAICVVAVVLWVAIGLGMYRFRWFVWVIGLIATAEIITADFNVYPQTDPALYYPAVPLLDALAHAPAGRVCGLDCFPASLTETAGLQDVRGYDGFSPLRIVQLLYLAQPKLQMAAGLPEVLQNFYPAKFPSPITRMIDLRYMIRSGAPPASVRTRWVFDGYWVEDDPTCLPRVFVPKRLEVVGDEGRRLALLLRDDFDPTEVAYVEPPATTLEKPAQGTAKIVDELPSHVTIEYDLRTAGLVVLSDLWDRGWRARINGVAAPIVRVNHAFRGVIAPAGRGVIQFDYAPASLSIGVAFAGTAAVVLAIWGLMFRRSFGPSSTHSRSGS